MRAARASLTTPSPPPSSVERVNGFFSPLDTTARADCYYLRNFLIFMSVTRRTLMASLTRRCTTVYNFEAERRLGNAAAFFIRQGFRHVMHRLAPPPVSCTPDSKRRNDISCICPTDTALSRLRRLTANVCFCNILAHIFRALECAWKTATPWVKFEPNPTLNIETAKLQGSADKTASFILVILALCSKMKTRFFSKILEIVCKNIENKFFSPLYLQLIERSKPPFCNDPSKITVRLFFRQFVELWV